MRIHLVVRGRVQGIGFRWFVREAARRAGVTGWVRNRPDGAVELEAEGAESALAELRATVARGPEGAAVSSVDELESSADTLPPTFTILR